MLSRFSAGLICVMLASAASMSRAADAPGQAPAFTLRIQSLDRVLEDAKYLATVAGKEEEAKQFDGFVRARMGAKGLEGVDTKRPLGLYSILGRNVNIALIPIASEEAFLGLLENLNIKASKEAAGIYAVTPEFVPVPIYLRFANKYAYVTALSKNSLDPSNLLDPATVLPPDDVHLLSAVAHIDRIPDALKQIFLQQMELAFANEAQKKQPGETDVQQKLRARVMRSVAQQLTLVVSQGSRLEVRVNVDRQSEELTAALSLSGRDRSELASEINRLGQSTSLFAAPMPSAAAFRLLVNFAISGEVRAAVATAIEEGIRHGIAKEKDAAGRAQAGRFLDALLPTVKAGELDAGLQLSGPTSEGFYSFLAGIKLKEGRAVEKEVRAIVKGLPTGVQALIVFDAEAAGEVRLHRIDAHKTFDAKARQTLGNNPLHLAFLPHAVWLSGGPNGLDLLKNALSAKPQAAPQLRLEVAVARLAPIIAQANKGNEQQISEAARKAFRSGDRNNVTLTIEEGKDLKARLVVPAPVIRFLASLPRPADKPTDEE